MGIKMYGLQLGHFGLDMEALLVGHPKYSVSPAKPSGQKTWYACPSLAYVIEHPEGRILFETGISPHWKRDWPKAWTDNPSVGWSEIKPEEFLEARLKSMRLAPDDFRYVVIGHMHLDHAGGLRFFENAGSEIVLHEDEYRGAISLEEDNYFVTRSDFEFLPRKKPTLIYGEQEILKGVKLISIPGHTWGTMGMLVHLDHTGWVLLTSDALAHHESYGPPAVYNMISIYHDKAVQSIEKIRRYATKYEALVAPGHSETGVKQHKDGTTGLVPLKYHPKYVYE